MFFFSPFSQFFLIHIEQVSIFTQSNGVCALSIYLSIYLSSQLASQLTIHMYMYIYLSIFIYLTINLSIYLSIYLYNIYINLSIHLSTPYSCTQSNGIEKYIFSFISFLYYSLYKYIKVLFFIVNMTINYILL